MPYSEGITMQPGKRGGRPVELVEALGASQLPVSDLMYGPTGRRALDVVFRLGKGALFAKLERLATTMPGVLAFRETAGIHQLYVVGDCAPRGMLESHYDDKNERAAA